MDSRPASGGEARTSPPTSDSVAAWGASTDGDLQPGDRIGPYVIRERIGEGGFAVVYLAEQEHPVRRRVAVKIVKIGMDTDQFVARFEAERQALALLDHPNVAKVLDAGASERGRPYFVMEHVPGVAITEHCNRHRLSIGDRLRLFIEVCEAIEHAHQKGIIHRDVKPSNVLVAVQNGAARVKLIDLGVAKAIDLRLTEKTIFTQQGQLIGTPEYMSPEQAEMSAQDVDTRTDIYSLGVLLYELLAGTLPFDPDTLRGAAYGEIRRIIREDDPPKPSTRLSRLGEGSATAAGPRRGDARAIAREIRGDLDWITMKAMEKDRTRRYPSASSLAADVRHHLAHEPVSAGPPSTSYRLRKFARRNRPLMIGATIVSVVLVGAATVSGWFAFSEAAARAEVETLAGNTQAVTGFLTNMLMGAAPLEHGPDTPLRDLLTAASEDVQEETNPEVEAAVRTALGAVFTRLVMLDEAEEHLTIAVAIRRELHGDDHLAVAESEAELAWLLQERGQLDRALELLERCLEVRRRHLGPDHPVVAETIQLQAMVLQLEGRLDESEVLLLEALDIQQRAGEAGRQELVNTMTELGQLHEQRDDFAAAEDWHRRALAIARDRSGDESAQVLFVRNNLVMVLRRTERFEEALVHAREVVRLGRVHIGPRHPGFAASVGELAMVLRGLGRYGEAETAVEEAIDIYRENYGDRHAYLAIALSQRAVLVADQGDNERAAELYREIIGMYATIYEPQEQGREHWTVANARSLFGECLTRLGRYEEAERELRSAFAGLEQQPRRAQRTALRLADLYERQGDEAKAASWRTEAERLGGE